MNKYLLLFLCGLSLSACNQSHFISDKGYRSLVEEKFETRKELAKEKESQLFSILDSDVPTEQKEALKFLYAFMPLNDLADYNSDFFLSQVEYAFKAKEEFAWGKKIPEDIFIE